MSLPEEGYGNRPISTRNWRLYRDGLRAPALVSLLFGALVLEAVLQPATG